jgi:2-haloalkanoic acid dehalogenase type II
MVSALAPLLARLAEPPPAESVLEAHARHESAQQLVTPTMPYAELLAVVYKRLAEDWRIAVTWAECQAYGASIADWPAFPDSAEALAYLGRHYRLAILSNVDNASFAHSNQKLGVSFDAVFTAQDIGSYKPSSRNFDYMLEKLATRGFGKRDILHTAESLFHDHVPANRHGLASCWIHRRHGQQGFGATMNPGSAPRYDFTFNSLAEMAEAHRRELTV